MTENFNFEQIEEGFLRVFLRDGHVDPTCVTISKGKFVDAFPLMNDKTLFALAVQLHCRKVGADTVVVYAEAWCSKVAIDQPMLVRPAEDPNRQEVLIAYVETTTEATNKLWPIIRDGSNVTLGDAEVLGVESGGGFNFHNLLGMDL